MTHQPPSYPIATPPGVGADMSWPPMKSAMERYERAKEAADEALNAMRGAKRHQFMVAALNCQTNEREGEISYEGAHLEWIIAELAFTSAFVALTYARKAQAEREEVKNDDITH